MEIAIVTFVGLPGSGKSTFASKISKCQSVTDLYDILTISYDNIIFVTHNDNTLNVKWKEKRQTLLTQLEELLLALFAGNPIPETLHIDMERLTGRNVIILLDDNMFYRSMRYKIYQVARRNRVRFVSLYFNRTLENCLYFNKARDKKFQVPESVIVEMSNKLEIPGDEQWEFSLVIDPWNVTDEEIVTLINRIYALPLPSENPCNTFKKEESRLKCNKSILHQLDISSRIIVREKINLCPLQERRLCALKFNEKRKEFLNLIKKGDLRIPENVKSAIENNDSKDIVLGTCLNFVSAYL